MNKRWMCWLLSLTLTLPLLAQDAGKFEFGLGMSPSVSWLKSSTKILESGGSVIKFGFGARVNYLMGEKYALGFEFNLQNVSAKAHFDKMVVEKPIGSAPQTSSDFNLEYDLRYIEIPVLIKMRTKANQPLSYYEEFGGNFGFIVNQYADVVSNELNLQQVNTKNPEGGDEFKISNPDNPSSVYSPKINVFKAGIVFGGGLQFNLENGSKVEAGLRYTLGITDIFDEPKWTATSQVLGLNMGFIF